MTTLVALTRAVPHAIQGCELSHIKRQPIDLVRAACQHSVYEQALKNAGCTIQHVRADSLWPHAAFVEDAAIVFDEFAVITRPGAESRRAEVAAVAKSLAPLRELLRIEAPGTLDGGDVLRIGSAVYVGTSSRTNRSGVHQLARLLEPHGYFVRPVPVEKCLHLKSGVTQVGQRTLLINPEWIDPRYFDGVDFIPVDPQEPHAANALMVNDVVLHADTHERTRARLWESGIRVWTVDLSELAKAEGAVTCCSLLVSLNPRSMSLSGYE